MPFLGCGDNTPQKNLVRFGRHGLEQPINKAIPRQVLNILDVFQSQPLQLSIGTFRTKFEQYQLRLSSFKKKCGDNTPNYLYFFDAR